MAQVINELVTKFGFEGTTKPLVEYNSSLAGSIKLLGGMYIGLSAAAGAFSAWADSQLTAIDSMGALSRQTKVSVAAIQELNYIAGQTQSSSGAMESSLKSLTGTIGSAALKGSEEFARLGISVRDAQGQIKSADKVLEEVGGSFKRLNISLQEQEHFASALGIDTSLLQMLNKTSVEMAGLRDRAKELSGVNAKQVEQAEEYKKSMNGMWFAMNSVKQLVAVGVAPELTRLASGFTNLIATNKDWIVSGIKVTVRVIGDLLGLFNRLMPVFGLIAAGFVAMKIAAIGFGGVMAFITSPIVLITAAIVGLLLIVDDLIVAFKGGKSFIADFFQEFLGIDIVPGLKVMVDSVVSLFETLWGWISKIWEGWKMIGGAISSIAPTTIKQGSSAGGVSSDNRQVNQQNQVNIYTNDAQAAGRAVGDSLQKQLENANIQLATGGR